MVLGLGAASIEIVISAVDNFSKNFKKLDLSLAKIRSGLLGAGAIGAVGAALFGAAIKQTIEFESAFAGVRKTVELTEEQFGELENRFKTLSTEIPITFVELAQIGEIAGQLGIEGVDNLEKFTRTIADISRTTNLTAEEAAFDFARIANIMGEPTENVDRMGSTIVDLGNKFAVTESEISGFSNRIASAGNVVGLTTADVMGIGAAFGAVGVQAERGGTAVQKTLFKMLEATQEGGDKLEAFGKTAGMSGEEFTKLFEEDAGKAFEQFVLGLGKQGDQAIATLDSVGMKDARMIQAFMALAGAGDLITETLDTAETAWGENNALVEEAEKRYGTLESQITLVKNEFAIMGEEIGAVLVPLITDYLIPALKFLTDWWGGLSEETKKALVVFTLITTATLLLAGAVGILMLVMSPITLIILGIGVAIGIVIAIMMNWKNVYMWLLDVIIKVTIAMLMAWEWYKDQWGILWAQIKNLFIGAWNSMLDYYDTVINKIIEGINMVISGMNKIKGVNIDFIPNVDLSKFKGAITDIESLRKQQEVERDELKERYIRAGELLMSGTEASFNKPEEDKPTTTVNIENVFGMEPDALSKALSDELNTKQSL